MECQEVSEAMSLYLDGALDADSTTVMRAHLASCATCQAEWLAFNRLTVLFTARPMAAPRSGFTTRTMRRIAQRQRQRRWAGTAVLALGGIALIALCLWTFLEGLFWLWPLIPDPFLLSYAPLIVGELASAAWTWVRTAWIVGSALFAAVDPWLIIAYTILGIAATYLWVRLVIVRQLTSHLAHAS
jgi:anti-sigma factor RsiW